MRKNAVLKAVLFISLTVFPLVFSADSFANAGDCILDFNNLVKAPAKSQELRMFDIQKDGANFRIVDNISQQSFVLDSKKVGIQIDDIQSTDFTIMVNTSFGVSNYVAVYNRIDRDVRYFDIRGLVEARDNNIFAKIAHPKSWFNSLYRINWSFEHRVNMSDDGRYLFVSYQTLEGRDRSMTIPVN